MPRITFLLRVVSQLLLENRSQYMYIIKHSQNKYVLTSTLALRSVEFILPIFRYTMVTTNDKPLVNGLMHFNMGGS